VSRELFKARSKRKDQTIEPVTQTNFSVGLIKNAPHDDIPDGALAGLRNAHAFPTECQPRLGTRLLDITAPAMLGRTGYVASKTGTVLTASAAIFTEADVSNYWVWPDETIHDEIIEFISTTQVRVHRSGNKGFTGGCYMHGRHNLMRYHWSKRKFVIQWGREIYIYDPAIVNGVIEFRNQTLAVCVSYFQPNNVLSDWSEMDDYGVIFNSTGTFLVDFDTTPPHIFKKNSPVPRVLLDDDPRIEGGQGILPSRRRYDAVYTVSRLEGQGLRTRTTEGIKILQESGPVRIDKEQDPPRDNAIVWTRNRIDSGLRTNGQLTCGALAAAQQTPAYWAGLNNATFQIVVNGQQEMFICDFTIATGAAITSLQEVAVEIQRVIRLVFYAATCEYNSDTFQFVLSSGEEDGSTMGYGVEGVGGTPVGVLMGITQAAGALLDNANIYAQPYSSGVFTVPPAIGTIPEWHWTHYVKYRSTDIGPDGVVSRIGPGGEILPPLKMTYTVEVRVAGAFYAYRTCITGIVTAVRGTFQIYDVGTSLVWEDGDVDTIIQWISDTEVLVSIPGDYYYCEDKPLQAAAIGGGNVFRASQTGTTVTRTNGDVFTIADERKTIWWSSDQNSIIRTFVDANTVIVWDSTTRDVQGMTLSPTGRYINDPTNDETLLNRQGELHVGLLTNRFWEEMPNVNVGEVVPGFMITAVRDSSFIYYCQLGASVKYLSGYHLTSRQTADKVEESIQTIRIMPNKAIVWCKGSTWGGPTNQPRVFTIPEFGEHFAVIYFDVIDANMGVSDTGSIQKIKTGLLEMICSDNSMRQFDGFKYSDDFTIEPSTGQDKIKRDFKLCWGLGISIYDGERLGHILWRKLKP